MFDDFTARSDMIAQVGHQAFGDDWLNVLAHSLPTFHPEGPRKAISPAMVKQWATGAVPVPDWVVRALPTMLAALVADMRSQALRIEGIVTALVAVEKDLLARGNAARRVYDA